MVPQALRRSRTTLQMFLHCTLNISIISLCIHDPVVKTIKLIKYKLISYMLPNPDQTTTLSLGQVQYAQ